MKFREAIVVYNVIGRTWSELVKQEAEAAVSACQLEKGNFKIMSFTGLMRNRYKITLGISLALTLFFVVPWISLAGERSRIVIIIGRKIKQIGSGSSVNSHDPVHAVDLIGVRVVVITACHQEK